MDGFAYSSTRRDSVEKLFLSSPVCLLDVVHLVYISLLLLCLWYLFIYSPLLCFIYANHDYHSTLLNAVLIY